MAWTAPGGVAGATDTYTMGAETDVHARAAACFERCHGYVHDADESGSSHSYGTSESDERVRAETGWAKYVNERDGNGGVTGSYERIVSLRGGLRVTRPSARSRRVTRTRRAVAVVPGAQDLTDLIRQSWHTQTRSRESRVARSAGYGSLS